MTEQVKSNNIQAAQEAPKSSKWDGFVAAFNVVSKYIGPMGARHAMLPMPGDEAQVARIAGPSKASLSAWQKATEGAEAREMRRDEEYLAQSGDIHELEHRQRELDKMRSGRQGPFGMRR